MTTKKYTSVTALHFSIGHNTANGSDIEGCDVRRTLMRRIGDLTDRDLANIAKAGMCETDLTQKQIVKTFKGLPGGGSVVNKLTDSFKSFRSADRQNEYHVRAVYFDMSTGATDSYAVDSKSIPEEVLDHYQDIGMESKGYAVYGGDPEPMFICGDQLPYAVAALVATGLNWFYATPEKGLHTK